MQAAVSQASGQPQPRLLDRVRDAIARRHYSSRTEDAYAHWIRRFIHFHGKRHPRDLGEAEVTAFLSYLARERDVAAATQNQALSALLFFIARRSISRLHGWRGWSGRSARRASRACSRRAPGQHA